MKTELFWLTVLFLTCLAVVAGLDSIYRDPNTGDWDTLLPRVLGVTACYVTSLVGSFLNTESFERRNPLGSLMLGMLIRTVMLLSAIGFATATKWNNHILFSGTLVGCYFSFLALESCLSIKRIHSRT